MPPALAPAPPPLHNQEINADNDLRAQLTAVINTPQSAANTTHHHNSHSTHGYGADSVPGAASNNSNSFHHHSGHHLDPAIAPSSSDMMSGSAGDSGGDDSLGDGRKGGKRELSQSKRAAQNRAAQRAFRQRKEGYIKKLEEQVRELHALEDNYKAIQTENYSLREYIIHLQSRLIESHGEFPQPPANVNLSHPSHHGGAASSTTSAPADRGEPSASGLGASAMSQLQASAAQAVADLSAGKRHEEGGPYGQSKRFKDSSSAGGESDPSEELSRQLRATADGMGSNI